MPGSSSVASFSSLLGTGFDWNNAFLCSGILAKQIAIWQGRTVIENTISTFETLGYFTVIEKIFDISIVVAIII